MHSLGAKYPRLKEFLPWVNLRVGETPVEQWTVDGVSLLTKRDDLSADTLGGNKVRALEVLLAGLGPDDTLLTVGPTGSTHALAVAHYGARLGIATEVIAWPQEVHDVAVATASRMARRARVTQVSSVAGAYVRAAVRRLRRRVRWIPAGGSSAHGALGHANAALELIAQLARDGLPVPDTIVVPLGSGGTVAGLLVGLAVAGVRTRVVGVRVVPSSVGNRWHVLRLARGTRAVLAQLTGEAIPPVDASRLVIEHGAYGGAYARETSEARHAAECLRASGGPRLDGTYSAKAFGHALARARRAPDEAVLFWLTFDGRWLDADDDEPLVPNPPR
ncbi:MAG: pyridoxal-phosphate dependent enzyme [bacterium]